MKWKDNKIKIFNKYAQYPKISHFDNKFLDKRQKYMLEKIFHQIKQNDSLQDELKYFFNCIKKKKTYYRFIFSKNFKCLK